MIRLGFGSIPTRATVRLGKHSNLTFNANFLRQPARSVSCLWNNRLRHRPRRLKLTAHRPRLLTTKMSIYDERNIYA